MSVNSIDDTYLNAIAQTQMLQQVSSTNSVTAAEDATMQLGATTAVSKTDSYFSGITASEEALPTGTYNSSGKYNDTTLTGSSTGTEEASESEASVSDAVSSSDSGSGSSSSASETETTSEVVSINGISYLQTTTVENGVTTITRQQIS